jgi:hypothetical protein
MGHEFGQSNGVALTEREAEELGARASELEHAIVKRCRDIRSAWVLLARDLHEFLEQRLWELLDYDSPKAWLASPDIEISWGHAYKLIRAYQELVVVRGVPMNALAGVDLEKCQMALPTLKAGKGSWKDAVDDAKILSRSDMRAKWLEDDPDAPLDATREPEKCSCPTCGSWVRKDKIEAAA